MISKFSSEKVLPEKSEKPAFTKVSARQRKLKGRKKIRDRGKGRRGIVLVFASTVFLSGLVYFKPKWISFWQDVASPTIISNLDEEKKFKAEVVLNKVKDLTKNLRGVYGFYVYQLGAENQYGLNYQRVFPAASLMKLPVLLTLYQQVEIEMLDLEEEYILKEADKIGGAGVLQAKPAGEIYTYRQLAEFMGQYSDNTANNVLVKVLGRGEIQRTIDKLGMKKTSFDDYEMSLEDMGLFFKKLYRGQIVTNQHRKEIFEILTKTAFENRIPAGVPDEIRVIHKIGTEIGNFSDAGIVFAPEPFVLVISSENARESEAKEVLPEIARVVWEFETGLNVK